jgi:hypothetical protein
MVERLHLLQLRLLHRLQHLLCLNLMILCLQYCLEQELQGEYFQLLLLIQA